MMDTRRNIYAFTEPAGSYPGYVSVNVEADGRVSVTVRSSPQDGREGATASFTLPADQSDLLTDAMIGHSYSDEEPCP